MSTATTPILRARLGRAALASGTSEVVIRILAIVLSVASARMLSPGEVGVLGLSVIIVGLTSMLAVYAETAGVVTQGPASHRYYAVVATALRASILAVLLPLLLLGVPSVAALLVGEGESAADLIGLVTILLAQPLIEVVTTYPRVVLQRNLELPPLAASAIVGASLSTLLGILALRHGGGTAGVARASVVATAVTAPVLWVFMVLRAPTGWREPAEPDSWKAVVGNALKLLPGGFTGYLNQKVDNLLVSSSVGPAMMSFYSMAWNTSRMSSGVLGQSVQSVLVPALARIGEDRGVIERGIGEALRHSFLMLCAISAALFVVADDLVSLVLGTKWLPMVPALRIMCVTALASPMIYVAGALLVGLGRGHLATLATIAQLAVLVAVMMPMAARWGVVGAACGDLLGVTALTVVLAATASGGVPGLALIGTRASVLPLMAATLAALAGWASGGLAVGGVSRLAMELATVGGAYLLVIGLLGGWTQITDIGELVGRALWLRSARISTS